MNRIIYSREPGDELKRRLIRAIRARIAELDISRSEAARRSGTLNSDWGAVMKESPEAARRLSLSKLLAMAHGIGLGVDLVIS